MYKLITATVMIKYTLMFGFINCVGHFYFNENYGPFSRKNCTILWGK